MTITRRGKLTRHVLAEQHNLGGVDTVGHLERAALVVAGLGKFMFVLDPKAMSPRSR
jgi:hypothetical protein